MSRRERPDRKRGPRAPRSDAPRNGAASDTPREVETEPNVLFVAGFPIDTEAKTVGLLFEKYGPVRHVRLSRGVGRVVFEENESANKGLSLNGSDYEGRKLRVELHHKRQRRTERPRAPRREQTSPRAEAAPARPANGRAQRPRRPRNASQTKAASAQPAEPKPLDPTRVFVGKLNPDTEDSDIQALFAPFGTIANFERSRNRRFALVKYSSADEAAKAVAAGVKLGDEALRVEAENPNSKAPRTRAPRPPRSPRVVDPATLDRKRLYFGYLPEGTSADTITTAYPGAANVELRGKFAYVTFNDEDSAKAALENSKKLGEQVRVEVAERTPRPRRERTAPAAAQ